MHNIDHALSEWISDFKSRNGRALRVLHIGNIANNAYLSAKFMREIGVDADVITREYFHIMANPEWEEAHFAQHWGDDNTPDVSPRVVGDYMRPRWFVQGDLIKTLAYLDARDASELAWQQLGTAKAHALLAAEAHALVADEVPIAEQPDLPMAGQPERFRALVLRFAKRMVGIRSAGAPHDREDVDESLASLFGEVVRRFARILATTALPRGWHEGALQRIDRMSDSIRSKNSHEELPQMEPSYEDKRVISLIELFDQYFPKRIDRMTVDDFLPYYSSIRPLEQIFARYDIVQAYGTDPILPMIASKTPYVAFEHGTLRTFIRDDNPTHRLVALAYRMADHVFVSNGDCLEHAEWLECRSITPVIHPVDVTQHRRVDHREVARLKQLYDADIILFCPLRHDWDIKGTDVHLRALPLIRRSVKGRVAFVTTPWGAQIAESRQLIEEMGCSDMVRWLEKPLSRLEMIAHLHLADVVMDQIALPHFGATAPQALAAGRPVIMSYKPESTDWIVSEPAPILPAFTPEEVGSAVLTALDPDWRAAFTPRCARWVDEQHSVVRLLNDQLNVYKSLLERTQ
jgi:hypothetical protein